jgi:hypothetical protein
VAHRDKSQSPEFTVGIDEKRTFVDKRSRPNLQRRPKADISQLGNAILIKPLKRRCVVVVFPSVASTCQQYGS